MRAAKLIGAVGLIVLSACSDAIGPDELPICAGAVMLEGMGVGGAPDDADRRTA